MSKHVLQGVACCSDDKGCLMLLQVSVSQVACTTLSMIGMTCGNLTAGYAQPLPGLTATTAATASSG